MSKKRNNDQMWEKRIRNRNKKEKKIRVKEFRHYFKLNIVRIYRGGGNGDGLAFELYSGQYILMEHRQQCCENVEIYDIVGNLSELIGSPIVEFEEVKLRHEIDELERPGEYDESFTWTFYKIGTMKGNVTIRWIGESTGAYSEEVDVKTVTELPKGYSMINQ